MQEIMLSLVTGLGAGMLFGALKLPVPAPATVAGVAGLVGLFLGYLLAVKIGWGNK